MMRFVRALSVLAVTAALTAMGGCQFFSIFGVMADTYEKTGSSTVEAEYLGLDGESFAVIVAADRMVQARQPRLVPRLTTSITAQLVAESGAEGYVPSPAVLDYQYNTPRWPALPYSEIAERFDVDRLIVIDLYEHRLFETGNSYLWDGLIAANVGVVEADGAFPNEFAYSKNVAVAFPDDEGYGPRDYTEQQVSLILEARFTNRVAWLFYEHTEPNDIEY